MERNDGGRGTEDGGRPRAKLALEDGTVFTGESFGAEGERSGEIVFNTSMSGYQEILTDPSYKGQIVTMTYPHIGNYGVNEEDFESAKPWVEGFVAREFTATPSNHRATMGIGEFFRRHGIVAIHGIDTRAVTRKLRIEGSLNGVLSTTDLDDASLVAKAKAIPKMSGQDLVKNVTSDRPRHWKEFVTKDLPHPGTLKYKVALIDCGALVRQAVDLVRADAHRRKVQLVEDGDGGEPALCHGDAGLLTEAIVNLLLNGIQACDRLPPQAPRKVTVSVRLDGPSLVVRIVDTGPGVSPDAAPRLFEPFFTTREGGTGLGLPIARRVAEGHGGTLTVENAPQGGAQATLALPVSKAEVAA